MRSTDVVCAKTKEVKKSNTTVEEALCQRQTFVSMFCLEHHFAKKSSDIRLLALRPGSDASSANFFVMHKPERVRVFEWSS